MLTNIKIESKKNIPYEVLLKARRKVSSFCYGVFYSRKVKTKIGVRYVLNVGKNYRLISKDKELWTLLSHASYDRYFN
ncbi:ParE family toxin-like protein [Pectobacterium polaris]|uniref:ParE family toxin-like protein n=1 Tax=Pectobacterium polaris TaxID=2042057 RepID=UPI003BEEFE0D